MEGRKKEGSSERDGKRKKQGVERERDRGRGDQRRRASSHIKSLVFLQRAAGSHWNALWRGAIGLDMWYGELHLAAGCAGDLRENKTGR